MQDMQDKARSMMDESCRTFAEALSQRTPVPGGGGAAAYVGALGVALCSMVARYDVGKPAFADEEEELAHTVAAAERIRFELERLVDEDAAAYELVSAAYAIPRDDPARPDAIERALHEAVLPPYRIMVACARAIELLERLAQDCSRLLLSDVGCGAMLCRGALDAANLTVCVNTASMRDRARAREIDEQCVALLAEWEPRAQAIADHAIGVMKKGYGHGHTA